MFNKKHTEMMDQRKPELRSYALFFIGFFILIAMLSAVFVTPKISNMLEANHQKELEVGSRLEAELFVRFIHSQRETLAGLASSPRLTNAIMQPSVVSPSSINFLNNAMIHGEKGRLVLQDIAGNILFKTSDDFQGSYDRDATWLKQFLLRNINHHFQLLSQKDQSFTFKITVPVHYANNVEGVLSAEVTAKFDAVFVGKLFENSIAFKLSQNDVNISTVNEHIVLPRETVVNIKEHNLAFSYVSDDSLFREKTLSLRYTIRVSCTRDW